MQIINDTFKINPKYLFYIIRSDAFKKQFDAKKHGLIGGVSVKEVSSIIIPFAPVEIQNKVVELIKKLGKGGSGLDPTLWQVRKF